MASLDGCLKGKHDFGAWYNTSQQPILDEFFRWRCHLCGAWMWRSEISSYDAEELRKVKGRVKWEVSAKQDGEARFALLSRKRQLLGDLVGVDSRLEAPSTGSPGAHSARSSGVHSPRSRGVDSKRPLRVGSTPRKAVARG